MKNSLLLSLSILAVSLSAQAANTPATAEKIALGLINDAAGDSWAEAGDVQRIDFTRLECQLETSKCELTYKVKVYGHPARIGSCSLAGIAGYNDLIEIARYGFVLKTGIFEQIDDCMTAAHI